MTTDTTHTYAYYLLLQHRVRHDIAANHSAQRYVNNDCDTNIALLKLMNKYESDTKTSGIVCNTITHNQAKSERLFTEYSALQSELARINTYLDSTDDIAGIAYDAAYAHVGSQSDSQSQNFWARIAKHFIQRTK